MTKIKTLRCVCFLELNGTWTTIEEIDPFVIDMQGDPCVIQ